MKIEFSRSAMEQKLGYARAFAETRSAIPVLGAVLCQAEKLEGGRNVLKITTTNLEISYTGIVDCDVQEEGTILLNCQKLLDITKTLNKEASATLSTAKDGKVVLKSARSKFTLNTMKTDDFPKLPKIEVDDSVPVNPFVIERAIRKTKRATSKALQTGRAILESLLFKFQGKNTCDDLHLITVGTDGHRLAYCRNDISPGEAKLASQEVPAWVQNGKQYVLPITGLVQVERILSDYMSSLKEGEEEDMVEIAPNAEKTAIGFAINDSILILQTLNYPYPDYEVLLEGEFKNSMRVDASQFASALKRVAVLTDSKHLEMTMKVTSAQCEMSHTSPELGEAVDTVSCELTGEPWTLNFNVRYVADGIEGVAEEEDALIEVPEKMKPVRIRGSKDAYKDDFKYILMPLR